MEDKLMLLPADRQILDGYKPIVDAIGQIFGSSCEVVLHSLEDLSHSVICIHNGAKTGRKIGSPVTDKALSILASLQDSDRVNSGLYFTKNAQGRYMRSSTTIIRGINGNPIGLLCINFDISTPFNELAAIMLSPEQSHTHDNEHFAIDLDDLLLNQVRKIQAEVQRDTTVPIRQKTKEIILRLHQAGVFKLRRSVPRVAAILNISRDVIYMHLRAQGKSKIPTKETDSRA